MMVGDRVRLRPVTLEDLPRFVEWLGDAQVNRHLSTPRFLSIEQEQAWFEALPARGEEAPRAVDALEDGAWVHVGSTGLLDIDWRVRSAEVGLLIGDTTRWGRGYGGEALLLLLGHAFDALGLHRVQLKVAAEHTRGRALYQRLGFVEEGALRGAAFADGAHGDLVVMSILAPEWRARRRR
ncbi:MAG: GNAT family N-acetyltransferase [Deltaproteobacteria bacterium]|nr:GNAT family N-acetyltransferase [Deltaproteobacteria bacterium]